MTSLARTSQPPPLSRRARTALLQLGGLLLLLLLWWVLTDVRKIWPAYVMPGPKAVWTEISYGLFGKAPDGKLAGAILSSLRRVATGYLIAVAAGTLAGLALSAWRGLRETVGGYLMAIQSVPSIAFVPLAIVVLGLNERAVLAVVILEGFIPMALSVSSALGNVPPALRVAGRTLGAGGMGLVTRVMLPASLPSLIGGLRTAWSFSWRALIGAELLTTNPGLGQLLEIGRNTANAALVIATILIVGVVGGLFDLLIRALEGRVRRDYGLEGEGLEGEA